MERHTTTSRTETERLPGIAEKLLRQGFRRLPGFRHPRAGDGAAAGRVRPDRGRCGGPRRRRQQAPHQQSAQLVLDPPNPAFRLVADSWAVLSDPARKIALRHRVRRPLHQGGSRRRGQAAAPFPAAEEGEGGQIRPEIARPRCWWTGAWYDAATNFSAASDFRSAYVVLSAAASATETTASAVSAPPTPPKPFDFSLDSTMPRPRISADQLRYCSEALQHFKAKAPQTIRQEFMTLQANRMTALDMRSRCTVAVDDISYSKNRYTDVLPFDDSRVMCADYRSSAAELLSTSKRREEEAMSSNSTNPRQTPSGYNSGDDSCA